LLSSNPGQTNVMGAALRSPGGIRPTVVTPVQNKNLVGPAVESAGQQLGRAALAFENDRAELLANDATMEYQTKIRELWLGKDSPDGFVPGYASTKGKDAVGKHETFQSTADTLRTSYIKSLSENAASRFIQKTFSIHNGYLNAGASHAATGKQVWQSDQIKLQGQQLSIELADAGMNPQMVAGKLALYGGNITAKLGEAAAQPILQNYYQQHSAFLAEQPGGLEKLSTLKSVLSDAKAGTQETMGAIDSQIRGVVRRNVTDARQSASEESRKSREAREKTGIELRTKLWNGEQISENALHSLLQRRQIDSSTHDYLVFNQREGASIPAISGSIMYQHKADILYGKTDSADIDNLHLNTADNKSLHNYLATAQGQQTNADLRAIRQEIQRIGSNPLFPNAANNIFSATKSAEDIYLKAKSQGKSVSPYTALQQASSSYFNQELTQQVSPPPVKMGPFSSVPRNEQHLKELYNQWKKGSGNLTPEQRQLQVDLFKSWRGKFEADSKVKNLRDKQLEDTTKP